MINHLTYNSKSTQFKTPYGAVPSGTEVSFTLRPNRDEGFSRGTLYATMEAQEDLVRTIPLIWQDYEGERDVFTTSLTTEDYLGLVWYTFVLEGVDGRRYELGPYQLTVYDDTEAVPTWFGEGMSYQIFPDRFRSTSVKNPIGQVGGREMHDTWDEEPVYRPNQQGEIRNRDYFGGDLKGVMEKLPYLEGLGVETIYFCPIFEASENHRYGTADYGKIDPMLGTNEDFTALCDEAHRRGMKIMLDGVFNHTGYVSRYFNGDGFYGKTGAAQEEDSPYRNWFQFKNWPKEYESWWGIYSLPAVNEKNPDYRNFIFGDKESVIRRWLRAGADGWRLDVADEVQDDFVAGIHQGARAENPNAVVIGEVWEDGTTKIAYGVRRKHVLGGHCDGLMNYPFRSAALNFFLGGDAREFIRSMEILRENYPPSAFYSAMNALGTHDTLRILTMLGSGGERKDQSRDWRSEFRLTPKDYEIARNKLMSASLLLFGFPGSPTVYYGDEAGMEGFEDPFNRRTYPWGDEDATLVDWFTALGQLRKNTPALRRGTIRYIAGRGSLLVFLREIGDETIMVAVNRGDDTASFHVPCGTRITKLLGDGDIVKTTHLRFCMPAYSGYMGKVETPELLSELSVYYF